MAARLNPRRPALPLSLLALVAIACGGDAAPSSTPTPSPKALGPVATRTAEPAGAIEAPTKRATPPTPRCPDPYPGGAPYEPTPGEAIRLRPSGSPPALAPYRALPVSTDPALQRLVRRSIRGMDDHVSLVVKNLDDGRGVVIDSGRSFYAASLFKTWLMLEAYHQREAGLLDFGERYIVSDAYEQYRLNPGELAPCSDVTVGETLGRMMAVSDNLAANLVLDRLGAGNVNEALRGLGLGASGFVPDGSLPTTAADMALLLEAIARRQAISEAASDEMLGLLESELIDDRLPALLPQGTRVAHKTGNWENATHDAGVVYSPAATYVIVVLTDFGFEDDGAALIARLSRAVYDYYNGG